MQAKTTSVSTEQDNDYASFEKLIAARVASIDGPLFTTNADGLWEAYLAGIPEEFRQHYTCHCCRRFIQRYGHLATIDARGQSSPLLWNPEFPAPELFTRAVGNMGGMVARAKVTGVFINGDAVWGNPKTGEWTHLHGHPAKVFKSVLKTADQEAAEKLQDYITLHKGLADIPMAAVVQAVRVLEADVVDRSEKTLGVGKWLLALHQQIADLKGRCRDNIVWLAVATAPPGWCHIRSTMIGTLIDDVLLGMPFDAIKRRWDAKMHPLRYQRPAAPPKDGNIEQANKIIAKLQSEGALERRYARLDEVTALWRPREAEPVAKKSGGAFDHLRTGKGAAVKEVELPAKAMTLDKFRAGVLPGALEVEVHLPYGNGSFYGLVTAVNQDTPPMLQWDGLEGLPRNPVSWYFWHGGSTPAQWGLSPGWNKVDAVCLKPCHWQSDKFTHQSPGVFFVIEAARDSRVAHGGYFPETLRTEYHGIRSVMESHSRSSTLAGKEEGNANGIALERGSITVRVKSKEGMVSYSLSL